MTTWTPPALASEGHAYAHLLWRVVEAQHTASTMRLVDSLEEQGTLEAVLELSKPALPDAARALHYLLGTPFRYRPRAGSRFRCAFEAGVWYGAELLRTALAEKSYWRLRFLLDSPGTPQLKPVPHTAFRAGCAPHAALDLTAEPLVRERSAWTSPVSYARTQALATGARAAGHRAHPLRVGARSGACRVCSRTDPCGVRPQQAARAADLVHRRRARAGALCAR